MNDDQHWRFSHCPADDKEELSDVQKYVKARKARDPQFAENFDIGYADFKIGALFKQARESAGLTQEEVAKKLNTQKSAISSKQFRGHHT